MSLRPNKNAHRSTPQQLADLYDTGRRVVFGVDQFGVERARVRDHKACQRVLADEGYASARLTGRNSEGAYMFMLVGAVLALLPFAVWAVN